MSPTLPRLDQLKQLLTLSAYSGTDNEENPVVKSNLITRVSLPQLIQASDDEINSALNSLNTIEINGLSFYFHYFTLPLINFSIRISSLSRQCGTA